MYKFFGHRFYQRIRISEENLRLDFQPVHCEDIGLYVIGKYPRLQYGSTTYNTEFNWQWHAMATIRLTILNLINNGVVEIVKVEDKSSYLYNTFTRINNDYIFRVTDLQFDKDWLSQLAYNSINEVNQTRHPDLCQYIRVILDKIIYAHSTYRKPSKAFIIQILRKYAKTFPWIQLDTKSKFLGLLENHSLKVAEIYIPRLSMQHQALSDLDNELFRHNKLYTYFSKRLNYEIEKDFKRRRTNND